MMSDIFFHNDNVDYLDCPICESKIKVDQISECHNKCIVFSFYRVLVFGEEYRITAGNYEKQFKIIDEKIEYWKENDRYLIKLIGAD